MKLARIAFATIVALPVWAPLWAQDKSTPPPPPQKTEEKGKSKSGDQKPAKEEPIDKRRDRMKQRDAEVDKILKQKGKQK
jgi:hypothetical protein